MGTSMLRVERHLRHLAQEVPICRQSSCKARNISLNVKWDSKEWLDSIRVHGREVTILAARRCCLTVQDGAELRIVASVLRIPYG